MHRQKVSMTKDILTNLNLKRESHGRPKCRQTTQKEYGDIT